MVMHNSKVYQVAASGSLQSGGNKCMADDNRKELNSENMILRVFRLTCVFTAIV